MSRIMIGSTVKHDYSGTKGKVLDYRRAKGNYNYLVEWDSGSTDWMKRKVLVLL